MSEHKAIVRWEFAGGDFLEGAYSRAHSWSFDGGVTVPASAAPTSVPPPFSVPANVDPEEAFVAAIASCHMLTFLYLASRGGFAVSSYLDEAVGRMTKNAKGIPWVSSVVLHPRIEYQADRAPTAEQEAALHHRAHEQCYIANSVTTEITVASSPTGNPVR